MMKRNPNDHKNAAKRVFAVLCMSLLLLVLAACNPRSAEVIAPAENSYQKDYHSFCTREQDESITIDGVLDEDVWQNKAWFVNTFLSNTNGTQPVLKVTGFPTEYGVYVAATVNDTNIMNNGQRSGGYNSIFEFEVTADNVGEYRVNDGLYKTKYLIDMRSDCYSRNPNIDRAVVVDGEINSGNTKGATLEMFIAWDDLQIDVSKGIPEEFRLQPSYRAILPGRNLNYPLVSTCYTSILTRDFFRFGKDGYVTADAEGAVLGDSVFGNNKTANWDISQEADGIVRSSGGTENHYIFFTDAYGPDFMVEATIIPVKPLENEYPKAGIMFQSTNSTSEATYFKVMLNCRDDNLTDSINGTKNFNTYWLATQHNHESWTMVSVPDTVGLPNPGASQREGVKLTVLKYGNRFMYFCDDQFVAMEDVEFMDLDVIPGFCTLGSDSIFKDYSCKTLDSETLKEYLGKNGMYLIDAAARGSQGTVTASKMAVEEGGSYEIVINTKPGYRVSSVTINGEEKLDDVKANGNGGYYTVRNVTTHQEIRASYEKCEGVKFTGTVTDGTSPVTADITLTNPSDQSLRYTFTSTAQKGFEAVIPAGTYRLSITAQNYEALIQHITIGDDLEQTFALTASQFPANVMVNGVTVNSNLDKWNTALLSEDKIMGSYDMGSKDKPLYFAETAVDFAVELTAHYTTNFQAGMDYQRDLMAGFRFHDGKNSGLIMAVNTGYVTTDWTFKQYILDTPVLLYPTKHPVTFGIAKVGSEVYIFINGKYLGKEPWSRISADIDPNSEVAIGLNMIADKPADIQISNYKLMTGTQAAKQYIEVNMPKDGALPENPMFATNLTVNGLQISSYLKNWDLSEVSNGVVKGTHELGSKMKALYFVGTGTSALMESTFEYTTTFAEGGEYQRDLMGGFIIKDGTNCGYLVAVNKGICYINDKGQWQFIQTLLTDPVLLYPDPKPVKMTVALNDNYLYVYLDDVFVYRLKLSAILTNYKEGTELAVGLTMVTDKTSEIRCSNISYSTDKQKVVDFIAATTQNDQNANAAISNYIPYATQLGKGQEVDKKGNVVSQIALSEKTTVFIGDSFFDRREEWWKGFYTDYYDGKDVFLAGLGGTRADQWQLLLDTVLAGFGDTSPKNIVINLGTNDIATGYAPEKVAEGLQTLIKTIREKYPQSNIYYCSIAHRAMNSYHSKIESTNSAMSAWCAQQDRVTYVDVSSRVTAAMLQDGLHPKPETYAIYVEELEKAGCIIEDK